MIKQVWKFPLDKKINGLIVVDIPKGGEILTVQVQNGEKYIWVLVDIQAEKEQRYFEIYGTGHNIHCAESIKRNYIGTFQLVGGALVFHLFERIEVSSLKDYELKK